MEIEAFGFEFGKKKTIEQKQEDVLQRFSAPETFDGTITVEAGGYFSSSIDYTGTLKDETSSIVQYRNMSVYPEVDNAIEEIVNAAIVKGTETVPVKMDLRDVPVSDAIKTKMYREFDRIVSLLDFNHRGYEMFRRWYIDSKLFYNIIIDKDNPQEGIKEIIPIDPLKIKKIRKVKKEPQKGFQQPVNMIKEMEEYYLYTDSDKDSFLLTGPGGLHLSMDTTIFVSPSQTVRS